MFAAIGDRIAVENAKDEMREATVIDIRDSNSATPTYLVEWVDNGHRQLVALDPSIAVERR